MSGIKELQNDSILSYHANNFPHNKKPNLHKKIKSNADKWQTCMVFEKEKESCKDYVNVSQKISIVCSSIISTADSSIFIFLSETSHISFFLLSDRGELGHIFLSLTLPLLTPSFSVFGLLISTSFINSLDSTFFSTPSSASVSPKCSSLKIIHHMLTILWTHTINKLY